MTSLNQPLFAVARHVSGFWVRNPNQKHVDCVAQRLEIKNWLAEALYWAGAIGVDELDSISRDVREELMWNLEPDKPRVTQDVLIRSFMQPNRRDVGLS